jgi:hypothetical protein
LPNNIAKLFIFKIGVRKAVYGQVSWVNVNKTPLRAGIKTIKRIETRKKSDKCTKYEILVPMLAFSHD